MATRYAVLKKTDDGEDEIIDIKLMEGTKPDLLDADEAATAEEVGEGPKIGMVKGGPVAPIEGYGFREGDARGPAALAEQEAAQVDRDRREARYDVERKRAAREGDVREQKKAAAAEKPAAKSAAKK